MKQLNYRDQFEKCLDDYQNMYKMMDNKLKFYSENENSLLESVKSTILKAYEKSESLSSKSKKEVAEIEDKITDLKATLESKTKEIESIKNNYEKKITDLTTQISIKSNQLEQLTTNYKVLEEDLKKNNNIINKLKDEIKTTVNSKNECTINLNECYQALNYYTSSTPQKSQGEIVLSQSNFNPKSEKIEELEQKLINANTEEIKTLKEEIENQEKVKANLNLIESKLKNLTHPKNSTLNNSIKKHEVHNIFETLDLGDESRIISEKKPLQVSKKFPLNSIRNLKDINVDKMNIHRFQQSTNNPNKTLNQKLSEFNKKQQILKQELEMTLFNNINKGKRIYQNLSDLEEHLYFVTEGRSKCINKLKTALSDNIELKEALAELEIKNRLSKINT